MNIVERAKRIILKPNEEWAVIDQETPTVQELFTGYVMILAAVPAVCSFIGWSIIGVGFGGMGGQYRVPIGSGVSYMILSYVLMVASVYALALIIDAFAPQFGGTKDFMSALKVAAYAPTASWVAGVFSLIPALAIIGTLGGLWSLYLVYTGLPKLMNAPEDKAIPYTVVVLIAVIVLAVVILAVAGLAIPGSMRGY